MMKNFKTLCASLILMIAFSSLVQCGRTSKKEKEQDIEKKRVELESKVNNCLTRICKEHHTREALEELSKAHTEEHFVQKILSIPHD